jgi:protoheme IX farnesyltransferase
MLPVVAGRATTARHILIYSIALLPVSLLPWALGFAGPIYGAVAALSGAIFVVFAIRVSWSRGTDSRAAHRLFAFSIFYLFTVFAALLASGNRSTTVLADCPIGGVVGSLQAVSPPDQVQAAHAPNCFKADEV